MNNDTDIPTFFEHNRLGTLALDKYGQILNETNSNEYNEMYFPQQEFSFNASSNNVLNSNSSSSNQQSSSTSSTSVTSNATHINMTQSQQMFQQFLIPTTNAALNQSQQHQQLLQIQAHLQAAAAAQQPVSPPQSLPQYQSQSSPAQPSTNYNDNSYNVPSPSQDLMSLLQQQQAQVQAQPSSASSHQQQLQLLQALQLQQQIQLQAAQVAAAQQQQQQQQNNASNTVSSIQQIQQQIQALQQAAQAQIQLPVVKQQQFQDNSYNVPNYSPITNLDNTPSSPLSTNHSIPSSPYQFNGTPLQIDEAIMNNSLSQFAQTYNSIEQQLISQPLYKQELQQEDDDEDTSNGKTKKSKKTKSSTSSSKSSKSSSISPISTSKMNSKSKELTQKEKSSEKCRKAIEEHKKRPVGQYFKPTIEFLPRDLIPEPNSVTNNHIITPPTVIRLNLPNSKTDFSNFWVTARLTEKDKFKIDYTKEHFDWDGYCTFNIKIEKPKGNEKTEFFKIRYDLFCEDQDGNPLYLGNIISDQIRYCYHTSSLPNPKIEFISPSLVNPLSLVPKLELNSSFFKHGDAHPLVVLFLDKFGKTVQHQQRPTKSNWTSEWSINIDTPVLPPGVYKVYAVYLKKNEDITSSLINNLNQDFSCDILYTDNTILSTTLINTFNNSGNNGGNNNNGNNNNGNNGGNDNNNGGYNNNGDGNNSDNNNNGGGYFSGNNGGGDGFNFNNYSLNVNGGNNVFYKIYIEISKCEELQLSKYETYRNIVNEINGDSLLMYSILANDLSTFNKMLTLKTNVNIKNNAHFNALHYAAYSSNNEFFNRLLSSSSSNSGEESIETSVNTPNHFGKYVIHMLAEIKNTTSIISLLNRYPNQFNVPDARGFIALHYLVMHRDEIGAFKLIEFWENNIKLEDATSGGGITTQSYSSGMNVLHLACAIGNVKIVNRLLKTRSFDLYQLDHKDEYCIHKAIDNQKYDVIRLLKYIGFDISLVQEEMKSIQSDLDDYDEDETTFTSRCQLDYIPKSYSQLDNTITNTTSTTNTDNISTQNTVNMKESSSSLISASSSVISNTSGSESISEEDLINRLIKLSHSDSSSYTPSSSLSHLPKSSSDTTTHLLSESSASGNVTFTFGSSTKKLDEIVEQLANKIRNLETTNKSLEQRISQQEGKLRDPNDPTEETYLDAINRFVKASDQTYQRVDKKTGKTVVLSTESMSAFKDNCKFLPSNIIGKIIASTEKDDKLIVDVDFYFENGQNLA